MPFVACDLCQLRRRDFFFQFADEELSFVRSLKREQITLSPDADILHVGETGKLFTLFAGWAYRYRDFPDGSRQILDFLLPGDLVGLQAAILPKTQYGVKALTAVSLCVLEATKLDQMLELAPNLSRVLLHSLMQDQRRTDGQLAFLGRRTAAQRMGYLLLELFDRLQRLGMTSDTWCQFPPQRRHLADALGLSGAHVNRSMADLRDSGLATLGNNVLVLLDRKRLEAFAGYSAVDEGNRIIL